MSENIELSDPKDEVQNAPPKVETVRDLREALDRLGDIRPGRTITFNGSVSRAGETLLAHCQKRFGEGLSRRALDTFTGEVGVEFHRIPREVNSMRLTEFVAKLAAIDRNWPTSEPQRGAKHSPDFRSVNWFGALYEFTPQQAACVKMLWEAWKNGTPTVGDATVLETAGSDAERLPLVFRDHLALGTMIIDGQTKGTHRLADPPVG